MSIELQNAYKYEAAEIDIEQMMLQMMSSYTESVNKKEQTLDKFAIRRMILARKYLEKEAAELVEMKKTIAAEWDGRIAKKTQAITDINSFMEHWLIQNNNSEKLVLDVGTLTFKTNPHKFGLDKTKALETRLHLMDQGKLESFLKPAELDDKLLVQDYQTQFNNMIELQFKEELEEIMKESPKVTKKAQDKLRKDIEATLLPKFVESLPTFISFSDSTKSLSLTSKVDLT